MESEADASINHEVLPNVIEFLDHFDVCLDVIVGCARKTEMTRWKRLFDVVGNPEPLFEVELLQIRGNNSSLTFLLVQKCLSDNQLKTAASYLLVLHSLEQLSDNSEAVRLLEKAISAKEWQLCRELLRFLQSIDDSGEILREVLAKTSLFSPDDPKVPIITNGKDH